MQFIGTLLLSSLLLCQGIWWIVMCMNDYFMSKVPDRTSRRKPQFISKTWHSVHFCKLPLEPILRIVLSLMFLVIDLSISKHWTLLDGNGDIIQGSAIQFTHTTLFIMFAVLGVAEIMESVKKIQFSSSAPHLILCMVFMAIGFVYHDSQQYDDTAVFKNHARLLSYVSFLASFVAAIESCLTKSFPVGYTRRFLTVLQGTWLFQMSFAALGQKPWNETKGNLVLIPLTFLWHVLVLTVLCLVCHGILLFAVNRYKQKQDILYNGHNSHRKIDEDSIPLGIVVNGDMLYEDDTSDIDTLYP